METREKTIEKLSVLLASSYSLALKTQNYHWNVTGPMFASLHVLFEVQYTELARALDEIAERIRALGARAPASYTEYAKLSKVEEDPSSPAATSMIEALADDHVLVASAARELIHSASKSDDDATADLATRQINFHEKNVWMLRSHLQQPSCHSSEHNPISLDHPGNRARRSAKIQNIEGKDHA